MQDNSSVVGSILNGFGFSVQAYTVVAGKDLANHNLYTRVLRSVSSGYAADSFSVVHGGNRTGNMCSMAYILHVCPRNVRSIGYEVIAVFIVLISVAVGICPGTELFALVHPYIVCQVGVRVHHAVVQYGNDNGRIACAFLPCFIATGIASGRRPGDDFACVVLLVEIVLTGVDVMPLIGKSGVRKSSSRYSATGGSPLLQGGLADIAAAVFNIIGTFDTLVSLNF